MHTLAGLHTHYRKTLLEGIVPFWLKHGIDHEYGGVLTCMKEDGELISHDKYLWSQGRAIWTFAAIYNRVEANPVLLEISRRTADFVLQHGLNDAGDTFFKLSRSGAVIEGASSVFTNFFAAYGLNELYRATRERRYYDAALQLFRRSAREIRQPFCQRLSPVYPPEKLAWAHVGPMIAIEVANELAVSSPAPELEEFITWAQERVMKYHRRSEMKTLLEHLDEHSNFVDTPGGRHVVPGHGIESMWFVIHAALRRDDQTIVQQAFEVIRWMLEQGWDDEFGGIFMCRDAKGGESWSVHWDKKLWWVHCEALYALVLGREHLGAPWCDAWYDHVHEWSFTHFADPRNGEWLQRLNRQGMLTTATVNLPVKDPFHWPRAVVLILQSLERQMGRGPSP